MRSFNTLSKFGSHCSIKETQKKVLNKIYSTGWKDFLQHKMIIDILWNCDTNFALSTVRTISNFTTIVHFSCFGLQVEQNKLQFFYDLKYFCVFWFLTAVTHLAMVGEALKIKRIIFNYQNWIMRPNCLNQDILYLFFGSFASLK